MATETIYVVHCDNCEAELSRNSAWSDKGWDRDRLQVGDEVFCDATCAHKYAAARVERAVSRAAERDKVEAG